MTKSLAESLTELSATWLAGPRVVAGCCAAFADALSEAVPGLPLESSIEEL
ncbi:MAG TPA: hypothetical protein PLW65_05050 [Pseudomonadota bacterium]|nr:hypothetical protein [Pseudomonadota bacterium]